MASIDYLVVGAGATGLAFADALVSEADVSMRIIDRRQAVGGHWRDAYPFVRLHTPSAYYGVNSLPLGGDRIVASGHNAGFYEQATGAEVCGYFQTVLAEGLVPSGRVLFEGRQEFLGVADGVASMRDVVTGTVTHVTVRRRVVDARYQEASIPATQVPSYTVDPDAAFVPVGLLPDRAGDYASFTVIGAGKTAADACLWLLDAGTDPGCIRWIRPRDMWFTDRAGLQPLDQVGATMAGLADDAECGAHATDLTDLCHRLEEAGRLMRIDRAVEPTMYRGTMLSRSELATLRQIDGVVRLGHVQEVRRTGIRLANGQITSKPRTLVIDCSAHGLSAAPPVPVFAPNTIRLQQLRHNSPTFNAALLGVIEARRDDDTDRNRLTPPNPYASTPRDMARMFTRTWTTERIWQREPDLQRWIDESRLNLLRGLPEKMRDAAVRAEAHRFTTNVAAAVERLPQLT